MNNLIKINILFCFIITFQVSLLGAEVSLSKPKTVNFKNKKNNKIRLFGLNEKDIQVTVFGIIEKKKKKYFIGKFQIVPNLITKAASEIHLLEGKEVMASGTLNNGIILLNSIKKHSSKAISSHLLSNFFTSKKQTQPRTDKYVHKMYKVKPKKPKVRQRYYSHARMHAGCKTTSCLSDRGQLGILGNLKK